MSTGKQIRDRLRAATAVVQAGRTHIERVAEGLAVTLGPGLAAPALIGGLVNLLDEQAKRLEASEVAWQEELADDAAPRAARDAAVAEMVASVVQARAALAAVYGEAVVARCGLSGTTPRDGHGLAPVAEAVLKRAHAAVAEAPARPGLQLDLATLLSPVAAALSAWQAASADVAREAREAEAAVMDRDRALAAYDEAFRRVAGTLTHLFALSGLPELAERVRPSARRPGRTAQALVPGEEADTDPPEPEG